MWAWERSISRETITTLNILHTTNDGACPEEEEAEPWPEFFL
jgi:hypothetical protein